MTANHAGDNIASRVENRDRVGENLAHATVDAVTADLGDDSRLQRRRGVRRGVQRYAERYSRSIAVRPCCTRQLDAVSTGAPGRVTNGTMR